MIGTSIRTYSGRMFDLLRPAASMVCEDDIAYALAGERRFTNHCHGHYSVAEHSLRVSWLVSPVPVLRVKALLHDATEAYTGDMSSPLKQAMRAVTAHLWYGDTPKSDADLIAARIDRAIAEAYGLDSLHDPEIKVADLTMLATEQRDLMSVHDPAEWQYAPLNEAITPMGEPLARRLWRSELRYWLARRDVEAQGTPGANVQRSA
jgi:hypothetical protein